MTTTAKEVRTTPTARTVRAPARGAAPGPGTATPVARFDGVTYRYGRGAGAVLALDGLELELRRGEVLAVLGPNGAGKTTAVRLLLGLRRPEAGSVTLFGQNPAAVPALRERVGVMLQISGVPETLKVGEHLELFRSYYPRPLPTGELVEASGLDGLMDRKFGDLSGGQRQRLLFALALAGDPDLLILDEPTVGLDVASRRSLWREIRRAADGGRSVLLATHYLDEADALADRVAVLARGRRIAHGTPVEIRETTAGRRVSARTRLDPGAVAGWEGVVRAERQGETLTVLARRPERVVARLLAEDPDASELEVVGAGLEEAFLALTGASEAAGETRSNHRIEQIQTGDDR